jgi:4-amino-4-deoxy-L-arabinose transferase-like glycosyltransferase
MTEEKTYGGMRFLVLFLAGLSFVDLAVMLVVIVLHAGWPGTVSAAVVNPLFYILAAGSCSSVVAGIFWLLLRYPKHRMTLLLLLMITTGIFLAHFYTINNPAAYTPYSLSGGVGQTVHDDRITLSSTLSGADLGITVQDSGGDAIGSLALSVGNVSLSDSALSSTPSVSAPLMPGAQVTGNWTVHTFSSTQITVSYVDMSCYDVSKQVQGCVMDEIYYVPAAQALLSGEKCAAGQDNCNIEHPFLSKAVIAAGIAIFGNNAFGWRFFEVVLGTLSIPVLFGICWSLTRDAKISLFAAYLLAFETLFFIHSSMAVIDVQSIFFALLAFLVYLADIRIWKLDRVTLAAVLLGVSALCKETAIFMVAFLLFYNLLFGTGGKNARALSTLKMLIIVGVVFAAGLQLYVSLFGAGGLTTFVDDIRYILSYGSGLKMTPTSQGWSVWGSGAPYITPFNWVTYYSAVGYFVTRIIGSYTYVSIGYWGITNFFEVWLTYIWAPYVVYLAYKLWASRAAVAGAVADLTSAVSIDTPSFRLARFALLWFVFCYFPYIALYYYGRITYPYYILPAIPAISIGCAYLLTRKWFFQEVAYVLLAGVFLWFFLYYPDKSFLPGQLRAILGH